MRFPISSPSARRAEPLARGGGEPGRTKLLVSVRNVAESQAAILGGADIVDLKEPARGPLGPVDPATLAAVLDQVGAAAPVSAAWGELLDWRPNLVSCLTSSVARLRFLKVGLAGCATRPAQWHAAWDAARRETPPGVALTPVAYADAATAESPSPRAAIDWAGAAGCRTMLIDTFRKDAGNLADHCLEEELCELVAAARRLRIRLGLAGSLAGQTFARVVGLGPALVGVRGAACRGGRQGVVDAALVGELAAAVAAAASDARR